MSSQNYFDLLGDDENEEPTAIIARATLPSLPDQPERLSTAGASPASLLKPTLSSEGIKQQKPFESGRTGRVGRGGRGSGRGNIGDREREGGSQREGRDGYVRDRTVYSDRNFSVNRDTVVDRFPGKSGGGYTGSIDAPGAMVGLDSLVGLGAERASRGENTLSEGSRGRGFRVAGRGRERGLGGDGDERHRRRDFDRRSGSGLGNEIKREGSGRGNWGAENDQESQKEVVDVPMVEEVEKAVADVEGIVDVDIDDSGTLIEDGVRKKEAQEEDKELTLDEYEKIFEEKRKVLLATKAEERKVQADTAFASMQLVDKKSDEYVFIKLGSDKEKKKKEKEALEKEDKAKKTQSINDFLKPADGSKYYGSAGSRGRGRVREGRGVDGERIVGNSSRGGLAGGLTNVRRVSAPRIEDPGQFPNLGGKPT